MPADAARAAPAPPGHRHHGRRQIQSVHLCAGEALAQLLGQQARAAADFQNAAGRGIFFDFPEQAAGHGPLDGRVAVVGGRGVIKTQADALLMLECHSR